MKPSLIWYRWRFSKPLVIIFGLSILVTACAGDPAPAPPADDLASAEVAAPQAADPTSPSPSLAEPQSGTELPDLPQLEGSTFVQDDTDYFISSLLPRDGIAPIYDPQFVTADRSTFLDDELVIGVEINGEAKAYPITLLNQREIVNDEVGGTPVLVTW